MTVFKKIQQLLSEYFLEPIESITLETSAYDIASWDSFSHMELMTKIENEFQITLPLKVIMDSENIGDIANYIDEVSQQ